MRNYFMSEQCFQHNNFVRARSDLIAMQLSLDELYKYVSKLQFLSEFSPARFDLFTISSSSSVYRWLHPSPVLFHLIYSSGLR